MEMQYSIRKQKSVMGIGLESMQQHYILNSERVMDSHIIASNITLKQSQRIMIGALQI